MNKTTIDYIKNRVNQVVKCTNGVIATKQEKKKKGTGLTDRRKVEQIRSGRATLIPDVEINEVNTGYRNSLKVLLMFFTYEITESQKEKIAYNERLDRATEEAQREVELAGEALVDEAVLGLIAIEDLPERLGAISRMASLV